MSAKISTQEITSVLKIYVQDSVQVTDVFGQPKKKFPRPRLVFPDFSVTKLFNLVFNTLALFPRPPNFDLIKSMQLLIKSMRTLKSRMGFLFTPKKLQSQLSSSPQNQVMVDAASDYRPLYNNWLGVSRFVKYENKFSYKKVGNKYERYQKVLYTKYSYPVQWQNIQNDFKRSLSWKKAFIPRLAYGFAMSLLLILQHDKKSVFNLAFMGAVAFDATSNNGGNVNVTSSTWSHTCTGSNLILIVGHHGSDSAKSASGVTYNSVAMTSVTSASIANNIDGSLWSLSAPATGANNVVASYNGGAAFRALDGAISFTGAAGTTSSPQTTTGQNPSLTVTSATNAMVVGCVGQKDNGTLTFTGTERWNVIASVTNRAGMDTYAGAASVTTGATTNVASAFALACSIDVASSSLTPNVNDSITITESVTMIIIDMPNVNDSITVTESVAISIIDLPNVNDSVIATESITLVIVHTPNVNDSITITESVSMLLVYNPSVNDTITVNESITIAVLVALSVNEAITVTENVNVQTVYLFSVSDVITVSESVSFQIVSQLSVNDTVTVSESTTILIPILTPSVSDSVTVSESITLLVNYTLNVNDSITATESVSMFIPTLKPSVNETISVSEYICIHPTTPYPLQSRNSTTFSQQSKNATDYNIC